MGDTPEAAKDAQGDYRDANLLTVNWCITIVHKKSINDKPAPIKERDDCSTKSG